MFIDYHVHSNYSGDGRASLTQQLDAALAAGVTHICFTDHVDFDGCGLTPANISRRNAQIAQLASRYPSIEIALGMEIGMKDQQSCRDAYNHVSGCELDFVIGSVHLVDDVDVFFPSYFEGKSREQAFGAYLEQLYKCIAFADFSIMGHYDFCTKYSPYQDRSLSYAAFPELFDGILRLLISRGKGFEINTSAWKDDPAWGLDILKRYRELGGEYITTGSDAHTPERVGGRINEAMELARAAGIRYAATFRAMQPVLHRL